MGYNKSMNYRVTVDVDTLTGEYEIQFSNVSHPGEPVDYSELRGFLKAIVGDFDEKVQSDPESIDAEVH